MVRPLGIFEWASILACAAIAAVILFTQHPGLASPAIVTFLSLLMVIWISVRDARDFMIPDGPVVCLGLMALAANLAHPMTPSTISLPVLNALACGGALLLVREIFYRRRGFDGMGFGDVKLGAACGAWIGIEGFAWAVFLASLTGLAIAAVLSVLRRDRKIERLPFGALLAPACWLLWVWGLPGAQP